MSCCARDTDSCVLELIARIDRGEMDETIAGVTVRQKSESEATS